MNFSQLTIGRRVAFGFALLLFIAAALGGFAVWRMIDAAKGADFLSQAIAPQSDLATRLAKASAGLQINARSFGFTGEPGYLENARRQLPKIEAELETARKLTAAQPRLTHLAASIDPAAKALAAFVDRLDATEKNLSELAALRERLDSEAETLISETTAYIRSQDKRLTEEILVGTDAAKLEERHHQAVAANDIIDLANAVRVHVNKAQARRDVSETEKAVQRFDKIDALRRDLVSATRQQEDLDRLEKIAAVAAAYQQSIQALGRNIAESDALTKTRIAIATQFDKDIGEIITHAADRTRDFATISSASLGAASSRVFWGLMLMIVTSVVVACIIIQGVNRRLTRTADSLTQGALQVASASGQVSAASQSLAEGSSEQAASLEEISSSIEELSSMTKRNADNAQAGKAASQHARTAAESGATEMERMQDAMNAIQQSSQDISKIIKTIDEIAFQTNILALNAAVEAARAGEAGAGFAVVADEVRSLAHRSAVAAKETADKIADATQKSAQGVELSGRVTASLRAIVEKAREVDRLVAEVATASHEQSEGLAQINTAVSQMDKVTQSNAANAEETASAAEELNVQSAELQQAAGQLSTLVGAKRSSMLSTASRAEDAPVKPRML